MKQLLAILFSTLILLQPLSKVWIVVSFKINQKEIARTLCVEKEIENNTCQGKCHLIKQIDRAEEQEKKQAPTSQKEKIESLYCHISQPIGFQYGNIELKERKLLQSYKNDFHLSDFFSEIFQPPERILA